MRVRTVPAHHRIQARIGMRRTPSPPVSFQRQYNGPMKEPHEYSRSELERILRACLGRTLEEVDVNHVLTRGAAGNKGYPGAVVEQSVLGYPPDSAKRPDLLVDGVETELKTTGIIESKRPEGGYEAKEPVSITAVTPKKIVKEEFESSQFWHKCAHLLFVYYLYAHPATPRDPATYADFPIMNYMFEDIDGTDKEAIRRDWTIVRDFIRDIQNQYPDNPESQYSRISSDLNRHRLTVLDTAPKYPNPPRFRFKRRFVSQFVSRCFDPHYRYEVLPQEYRGIDEVDAKCHELTVKYRGRTVGELFTLLGIESSRPSKQDAERVIVRMFGGNSHKLSRVGMFEKYSITAKSVTVTTNGTRTEDMKLDPIDWDEVQDRTQSFEDSAFRAGLAENQFLFIVFEEPSHDAPFADNRFLGFKRYTFPEAFIEQEARRTWDEMRALIFENRLRLVQERLRDGSLRYNKNGTVREAPNWPKARDHAVFLRGSANDSNPQHKTLEINGIRMYPQNLWVKGTYITGQIARLDYL